jgi:hypothetical protein
MPEAWYVIWIAVGITIIAYTGLITLLWLLFMPTYITHKIREATMQYTGKSCFNCEHFTIGYYNNELWCNEIGLEMARGAKHCAAWKQKRYDLEEEKK